MASLLVVKNRGGAVCAGGGKEGGESPRVNQALAPCLTSAREIGPTVVASERLA